MHLPGAHAQRVAVVRDAQRDARQHGGEGAARRGEGELRACRLHEHLRGMHSIMPLVSAQ